MDPDANYDEQRTLHGSKDPDNIARRDELVAAMREWIRHGGFKPRGYKGPAWEPCAEEEKTLISGEKKEFEENVGRSPGKFEASGNVGRKLHDIVLDGRQDDECGDVNGPGDRWYGLILESGVPGAEYAIVSESSSGFFDYESFETPEAAREKFDKIASEVAEEERDIEEVDAKQLGALGDYYGSSQSDGSRIYIGEAAEKLSHWHSSQNDPIYSLSSHYLARGERPPNDLLEKAIRNLNSSRSAQLDDEANEEIEDLISFLQGILDEQS